MSAQWRATLKYWSKVKVENTVLKLRRTAVVAAICGDVVYVEYHDGDSVGTYRVSDGRSINEPSWRLDPPARGGRRVSGCAGECGCCDRPVPAPCAHYEAGHNGRCVYCDHAKMCHNVDAIANSPNRHERRTRAKWKKAERNEDAICL